MSRRCWRPWPCDRTANVYAAQRSVALTLANIFLVFDHYLTFWAVPSTFPPSHAAGRSQDRGMESYSNSCKETHVYAKAPFQRSASGRCTIISVRGFRMKYFRYAPSLKTIRQYLFNIMTSLFPFLLPAIETWYQALASMRPRTSFTLPKDCHTTVPVVAVLLKDNGMWPTPRNVHSNFFS